MPTCRAKIPRDQQAAATRASAAVHGRAKSSCFAPPHEAASVPTSGRPPSDSAALSLPWGSHPSELRKLSVCLVDLVGHDRLAWEITDASALDCKKPHGVDRLYRRAGDVGRVRHINRRPKTSRSIASRCRRAVLL